MDSEFLGGCDVGIDLCVSMCFQGWEPHNLMLSRAQRGYDNISSWCMKLVQIPNLEFPVLVIAKCISQTHLVLILCSKDVWRWLILYFLKFPYKISSLDCKLCTIQFVHLKFSIKWPWDLQRHWKNMYMYEIYIVCCDWILLFWIFSKVIHILWYANTSFYFHFCYNLTSYKLIVLNG